MSKEDEIDTLRRYQKNNTPSLAVNDVQIETIFKREHNQKNAETIEFENRYYTKPLDGDKDFYLIVLIVEDSTKTSKYLAPIANEILRGFKIIPVSNKERGIPVSHMKEKAEECMIAYSLSFESGDELYMVCDLDHYRKPLMHLLKNKNPHWRLIISNPCIEIWLYYGKAKEKPNNRTVAFDCPEEEDKISQAFKAYLGELIPGGIDPRKAILDIETASANAKYHYSEDDDGIPVLYSTSMYKLADRLLEFIKPKIKILRDEKIAMEHKH